VWAEIKQMWDGGFQDYIHDWWNLMDFVMNSLYLATISLKIVAYVRVKNVLFLYKINPIGAVSQTEIKPRLKWPFKTD